MAARSTASRRGFSLNAAARLCAPVLRGAAFLAAMSVSPSAVRAAECAAASVDCAALVQLGCMPSLGAGSVSTGTAADCEDQKRAYRSCLQDLVKRCDQGPQPGSQPLAADKSDGWGDNALPAPARCAVGGWTGWVVEPGASSYTIELDVSIVNGGAVARSWYPELDCGGGGPAVAGSTPERLLMAETITHNRDRCADGRFSLTCLGDGRLLWRWYRNTGESFDAVLTRR